MKQTIQILSFSFLKTFTEKSFPMLFLLVFTQQALAQFTDNFEDGTLLSNPIWMVDESRFTISEGKLKLSAPAVTGVSWLSTESASINNASWEFSVRIVFNPSGSNYARVYLTSDRADLTLPLNGYYVMIGNTTDEISLYKQTGSSRLEIIDGLDGRLNVSSSEMNIKVTRDALGNWQLFSDVGLTGTFTAEGSAVDAEHFSSTYFGILCNYTATRSDKFFFDDIVVTGDPYIPPAPPSYKDVIITEIFADPSPRVELPEAEFLEIHNRSENSFNLSGWKLSDGTSTATLPGVILSAGEYLIITSASAAADYTSFGKTIGVSNFPSLNNASDAIVLRSSTGLLIDSVRYQSTWYPSDWKREGGWSLEIIDLANVCGEENNWTESEDENGGTPGKVNSVLANKPDVSGPVFLSAIPSSDSVLLLFFNEKLSSELPAVENFIAQPAINIKKIEFLDGSLRTYKLSLTEPLHTKTTYAISATAIVDCAGNALQLTLRPMTFALPEPSDRLNVVINEILFNPKPTGVDFIEVVNVSDKYLDLKSWSTANIEGNVLRNEKLITTDHRLVAPGEYIVLTTSKQVLIGEYLQAHADNIMEVKALPAMNDDAGSIAILNEQGKILDHLVYTKQLHSVFIRDEEGVSLERISFTAETNDPQNWKSASSRSNFATPGYVNSQSRQDVLHDDAVVITPEIFAPVNGNPDFTEIQYHFEQSGFVANVKILDSNGREIKRLANNELLGTSGFIRWDGDQNDGTKARVGYYMVWFEVIDPAGSVKTIRKRLAIASRF